jgi:hypothetical protein
MEQEEKKKIQSLSPACFSFLAEELMIGLYVQLKKNYAIIISKLIFKTLKQINKVSHMLISHLPQLWNIIRKHYGVKKKSLIIIN